MSYPLVGGFTLSPEFYEQPWAPRAGLDQIDEIHDILALTS